MNTFTRTTTGAITAVLPSSIPEDAVQLALQLSERDIALGDIAAAWQTDLMCEPVTVVQARLGHSSGVRILDTYGHLWPDDGIQTREAVDDVSLHARHYL